MTNFNPGVIVKTFTSKSGKKATIRYLKWTDLNQLLDYANTLSKEDTFVSFSGEELSKKEETEYLASKFKDQELGDCVALGCFIDEKLVGFSAVDRHKKSRKRGLHIGHLGLSVHKDHRSDGIGYTLTKTVIDEAQKKIDGLRLIVLSVFGVNEIAIKLYEKLGFKQYGSLEGGIRYKGEYIPHNYMVLKLNNE